MTRRLLVTTFVCILAMPLAAQHTFTAKVVLDVGGLMSNPAEELTNVSSVVRTSNGQYVVANGKPLEVRLYDAKGKLIRLLGRAGSGPGEFRLSARVFPWAGDSILAYTGGTRRWMLFGFNGTLIREWPVDSTHPVPRGTVLRNWAFTPNTIIGNRGCPQTVVDKLPEPSPWEPRETLTDPAGRVWVRTTDVLWQIYSPTSARLGTVTVPGHFNILQFSGNFVIGHRIDADDAEHFTVLQLSLPEAPQAAALCAAPLLTDSISARMKMDASRLRVIGEQIRSDTGKFPTEVPAIGVKIAPETRVQFLISTKDSWVVLFRSKTSSLHCMFSIGPQGVPAWGETDLACSK